MTTPTVAVKDKTGPKKKPRSGSVPEQKLWKALMQNARRLEELEKRTTALEKAKNISGLSAGVEELITDPRAYERDLSPASFLSIKHKIQYMPPVDKAWAAIKLEWYEAGFIPELNERDIAALRKALFNVRTDRSGMSFIHWRKKKPKHLWISCGGQGLDTAWCYSVQANVRDPEKANWQRLIPLDKEPTIHTFEGWTVTVESIIRETLQDFLHHDVIRHSIPRELQEDVKLQEALFELATEVKKHLSFQSDTDLVAEVIAKYGAISEEVLEARKLIEAQNNKK